MYDPHIEYILENNVRQNFRLFKKCESSSMICNEVPIPAVKTKAVGKTARWGFPSKTFSCILRNMKIRPYIIVPNLIEQSTWGGNYIVQYKRIADPILLNKKIGQSYELYEFSRLSMNVTTKEHPSLELGNPQHPKKSHRIPQQDASFFISQLIKENPEHVLGKRYVKKFGSKIQTLIKFTQAKGNSYQMHVKRKSGNWLPKSESWYFFEPGIVTLGIKSNVAWDGYQALCEEINSRAEDLSHQVQRGNMPLEFARKHMQEYIAQQNPEQFVHVVKIKKNQAIDLSLCGIHHSWEEDDHVAPFGNILYEVQENVYDENSTIRCFDKGKIQDDGSIRALQIGDYFTYIDRDPWMNSPKNHRIKITILKKTASVLIKQIFTTDHYSMQEIEFKHSYVDKTNGSFHHLFVKDGSLQLIVDAIHLTVSKGFSVFVPANVTTYQLIADQRPATVLKTYL